MTESVQKFIDEEFPFKLDEDVLVQIRKPYEANFDLLSKELSDDKSETQQDSEHVTLVSGNMDFLKSAEYFIFISNSIRLCRCFLNYHIA
jgi:hypothetical protein